MDLHFTSASATQAERAVIDTAAGSNGTGSASDRRGRRHLLLPVLHAVQNQFGWISEGALNYVSERLAVAPAEAYGVATFYAMLSTKPRPRRVTLVCDDIACLIAGAQARSLEIERDDESWERSPCLGQCDRAPATLIVNDPQPPAAPAHVGGNGLRLLRRVGSIDPESLDSYRAHGGYAALAKALELGPERVIAEVVASNLLGRGGAAFPTGRKMTAVAKADERPHYLICNADESEPGTFKDRVLMEEDPFAIVEAMTISGYAGACEKGYIYIRGEYPLAAARIGNAIAQARTAGLLGDDVMGRNAAFRYRAKARRRRVHLRRRDRALQLDRRQARRTAQQAAVPGSSRSLRQADTHQ